LEEEVEKLAEALLKASEKVEKVIKDKLGERVQDIDFEIALEVGEEKKVDAFLEIKGLKSKYSYDEVAEEALDAGLQELEKGISRERKGAAGEAEEGEGSGSSTQTR